MKTPRFALTALLALCALPALADDALKAKAHDLMIAFTEAVASRDQARLAEVLAPEYQIVRANGTTFDRDGYIGANAGGVKITSLPEYENIVATEGGDVLVVSSVLTIEETIDGQPVTKRAPRLTVFRRIDGHWRVSAHANFARPE